MKNGGAYGAAPGFAKLKLIKKKYKLKFFYKPNCEKHMIHTNSMTKFLSERKKKNISYNS